MPLQRGSVKNRGMFAADWAKELLRIKRLSSKTNWKFAVRAYVASVAASTSKGTSQREASERDCAAELAAGCTGVLTAGMPPSQVLVPLGAARRATAGAGGRAEVPPETRSVRRPNPLTASASCRGQSGIRGRRDSG